LSHNTDFRRTAWYGILAANTAIILFYWWQGSGSLLHHGWPAVAIAFGRLSGLLAAGSVLLQFAFMGRTPWLERVFGLDKLSRIHHTTGKVSFVFLLLHPVLLTIGYSAQAEVGLAAQFMSFLVEYEHVGWAALGLMLFMVVVVTSLVIVRSRLRYESWYFVHVLVYLAVFFSFWHQLDVGSDLLSNRFFYGYWIALYMVVLGAHVVFRFMRPVYLFERHRFRVNRITRENYNTVSVHITGRDLNAFTIYPGQFMIVRFFTKGLWWQAHPFSLSMLPNGQELRITVKELGDFTQQVQHIPLGTNVLIDGPYGVFTEWMSIAPKTLFIAGGIGITPIRSLMEEMLRRRKEATLLYGNKTRQDIVFADELNTLARQYSTKVVNVLSDEADYQGERGFIDEEKIRRFAPDVAARDVYVCGPPPMMAAVVALLHKMGVPGAHIHFEKFSL
jgi:predicted ferric reductase